MEFSIRISYKRPSTDVAWGKPSKDYEDYVEKTYDDTGKRLSVVEEGEDTLERTQTTVWKDQESFFEFKTDAICMFGCFQGSSFSNKINQNLRNLMNKKVPCTFTVLL